MSGHEEKEDRAEKGSFWRTRDRIKILGIVDRDYLVEEVNEDGSTLEEPFRIPQYILKKYYINELAIKENATK